MNLYSVNYSQLSRVIDHTETNHDLQTMPNHFPYDPDLQRGSPSSRAPATTLAPTEEELGLWDPRQL